MKTLDKYVKCEGCGNTLVKKVYAGHGNKLLCQECRGPKRKSKKVMKDQSTGIRVHNDCRGGDGVNPLDSWQARMSICHTCLNAGSDDRLTCVRGHTQTVIDDGSKKRVLYYAPDLGCPEFDYKGWSPEQIKWVP